MLVSKETTMDVTYLETMQVLLTVAIMLVAFSVGSYLGKLFR